MDPLGRLVAVASSGMISCREHEYEIEEQLQSSDLALLFGDFVN